MRSKLIYILAASHSGSTLTAMLLNTHPVIHTSGELKATNLGDSSQYRCSCHRLIHDCPFWDAIHTRMDSKHPGFRIWDPKTHYKYLNSAIVQKLTNPLYRGGILEVVRSLGLSMSSEWRKHLGPMMARNTDVIEAIMQETGAEFVVDSSKVGLRLALLRKHTDIDLHVVRVVRDGRAVALTYINPQEFADAKKEELRGGGSGGNGAHILNMAEAAREWRRSNEEADALVAELPASRLATIHYEDLCTDPLKELNGIFTKFGLSGLEELPAFKDIEHHVVGNGMRLDKESKIVLDDRWKTALDNSQLETFDAVAGAYNKCLGYK